MAKDLRFTLEVATRNAIAELKKVAAAADDVGDELDDSRSAGKRFADAMRTLADGVERDLAEAEKATEALERALGDEFVQAAKAAGTSVDQMVADLKAAGLTYDDVTQDADELADAIRRVDQTAGKMNGVTSGLNDVGTGFREVGAEADNTRSVVANFAGNAVQELPGVTGAMGPLNMAIGQFAEYASEGNIRMRNFIAAAAPLALAAGVAAKVADHFGDIAETKAFRRDQVEAFTEALRDAADAGEDARDALTDMARDTGAIEFRFLDKTMDLVPALDAAGMAADEFFGYVENGTPGLENLRDALEAAGLSANEIEFIMVAARQKSEDFAKATNEVNQELRVFGKEAETATEKAEDHADAIDAVVSSVEKAIQAHKDETAALEEQQRKTDELIDAKRELVGGELGVRSAQNRAAMAVQAYDETLADAEATTWDKSDADIAAREALLNAATAATEWEVAQREAAGQTVSAAEQSAIFSRKLGEVATTLAPGSPLRNELQGYIGQLNSIPAVRNTVITSQFQSVGAPGGAGSYSSYAPGVGNTTINVSVTAPYGSNPVEFGRRVAEALTAYRRAGGISANTYF